MASLPGGSTVRPTAQVTGISGFTGRAGQLADLDALLAADRPVSVVVISAVSGTAGVGKTALALHWAGRVADRFPDGQVHADLRGLETPVPPAEAVHGLLDALGVPPGQVPAGLDAQLARYRARLAGRRVLVVLDNARDAGQVRPLLPASSTCLVVVTSRNRLAGLVADGAHPVSVDLFTVAEARELLAHRLGAARVAAEPDAVDEIIGLCARLPLALAVVAARAAGQSRVPLAALAEQLREARGPLDAFDAGDPASEVRAAFAWSYDRLGGATARLFRLLALHPGPDLTRPAAASLAGLPPRRVAAALAELADANLVEERVPGRYALHDLLRAYATELAYRSEAADDRQAALHRVLDHYLHSAAVAARALNPGRDPHLEPPPPGVTPEDVTGADAATAWFTAERRILLALVDRAAGAGFDRQAWQLAWTLADFFERRGRWRDAIEASRTALGAARRLDDTGAQAGLHRLAGRAYARLGRYDEADPHLRRALDIVRRAGDAAGEGQAHDDLARMLSGQGRASEALPHALRALRRFEASGDAAGRARALDTAGWCHAQLGDHDRALAFGRQALALMRQAGDRPGAARTWDHLGFAHRGLGQHAEAADCYRHAAATFGALGLREREAGSLVGLGDALRAAGADAAARDAWRRARAVLAELGSPDAAEVDARLRHT